MHVSGVLSSWETLATNSLRTRSSRRSSVTSWSTRSTPAGAGPRPRGAPRAATTRLTGGPSSSSCRAGAPETRTSSTRSSSSFCRMTSRKERPSAIPFPTPNIASRRRIEQQETPPVVQRHHSLGHAVEDRAHLRLLVAEALDLLAEGHRRPVEGDAESGDLVRARDRHRLREVALGHAPGGVLHSPERPRHPPAHEEADHHGHGDGEHGAAGQGAADQGPGLVDVVRREREPEDRAPLAAPLERHRDVQEVAADGRAPTNVAADLPASAWRTSGRPA